MKLYWSSRSPFVRKVMVVAHETGLAPRIATERVVVSATKPNAEVMKSNPLGKLPTLILGDGRALYDSRVICEHLESLHGGSRLFPADPAARIEALRRQALGDGMMDFLLVWLLERIKPEAQQQGELIAGCRMKLKACLDQLEGEAQALAASPISIGHIALATALGYADFRFKDESWRDGRSRLAAWAESMHARPSFTATAHADVY